MKLVIGIVWVGIMVLIPIYGAQASEEELDQELITAAGDGDIETVKRLLDKGANIDARNEAYDTPLLVASENGEIEIVDLLLKMGAKIEGGSGGTLLRKAAFNGHTEIVKLLLDKGVNIESGNVYGYTALMEAAGSAQTKTVELLLTEGANIHAKGMDGVTPLMRAAQNGNAKIVKQLVEKGANVETKDNNGRTALMLAWGTNTETVAFLEKISGPHASLQQYIAVLQTNPGDQSLRAKIINLVQTIKPEPAIPQEAKDHAVRAQYAFKDAKRQADYAEAIKEYEAAVELAPWVTDYYFNLGVAQERAGQLPHAKLSFQFYLLAKPDAEDAEAVRERIVGIDYQSKRVVKDLVDTESGWIGRISEVDFPSSQGKSMELLLLLFPGGSWLGRDDDVRREFFLEGSIGIITSRGMLITIPYVCSGAAVCDSQHQSIKFIDAPWTKGIEISGFQCRDSKADRTYNCSFHIAKVKELGRTPCTNDYYGKQMCAHSNQESCTLDLDKEDGPSQIEFACPVMMLVTDKSEIFPRHHYQWGSK